MPRHIPSDHETLLLKAAVLPPQQALEAWQEWLARNDVLLSSKADLDLFPAVFHNLGELLTDDHHRGTLHGAYRRSWLQNQILLSKAASAIDLLAARGIETLVLKGGALVKDVYGNPGSRPMADVDLLVPTAKAEPAYELLLANGWTGERDHRGDMGHVTQVLRSIDLIRADGSRLDLHWHVLLECCEPSDDDAFWASAADTSAGAASTRRLCLEDMLLHVLVHGAYWTDTHAVTWAMDAYRILDVAGDSFDWQRFLDQAARRRLTLPARSGLAYLRDQLGAPVASEALAFLTSRSVTLVERAAFRAQSVPAGSLPRLYRDFVEYLLRSRRRPLHMRARGWVWYLQAVLNVRRPWQLPFRLVFLAGRAPLRALRTKG